MSLNKMCNRMFSKTCNTFQEVMSKMVDIYEMKWQPTQHIFQNRTVKFVDHIVCFTVDL